MKGFEDGVRIDALLRAWAIWGWLSNDSENEGTIRKGSDDIAFCSLCWENKSLVLDEELSVDNVSRKIVYGKKVYAVLGSEGKSEMV